MTLAALWLAASLQLFGSGFSFDDVLVAVRNGKVREVAGYLAKGADVEATDRDGNTLLMIAIREKDAAMTDLLLRARARVNVRNLRDETPLMLGAWNGCVPCVHLLLEREAVIDHPGSAWTPLHYAAMQGSVGVVTLLLQAGADPNARSANGNTPLMMGAMSGIPGVARALLAAGANPALRNLNQDRAEDLAAKRGHTDYVALMRGEEPRSLVDRVLDAVKPAARSDRVPVTAAP